MATAAEGDSVIIQYPHPMESYGGQVHQVVNGEQAVVLIPMVVPVEQLRVIVRQVEPTSKQR